MKTSEFLAHLKSLGIRLSVEGGDLKIKAPRGALTAEVRRELGARKAELVAALAARPAVKAPTSLPPIEVVPRDGRLPLSFTQERIWFMDQLEPGITAYNMWIACQLRGALDVEALERAVGEIVRRHEVLRTTFSSADGVPYQRVADRLEIRFERIGNLGGQGPRLSDREVSALLTPLVDTPFDLERGPLIRPVLVDVAEDDHVLFIAVHHTVFDGVSQGVFYRELMTLYEAFSRGRPSTLPELPVQYADYAAWQRRLYGESGFGGQLDYWKDILGGTLPVLDLPTDHPRPAVQTHNGATAYRWMTQSTIDALDKVGKSKGATLFMVLLAAYKAFLHRYTRQTDLLVGTAMANRNRAEVERLIGFFVNTLVMRTDVSGDPTFRELMVRVRDVCLGALENQDMPFQLLVDELQPERSLSHTPLFQTLFVLDEDPGDSRSMDSLELDGFDLTKHFARTDLVMTGYSGRDGFYFWAEYNTDLFDTDTIQRMLGHYVQLLEGIAADPDLRLSELPMLSDQDVATVTSDWNDTAADYPREPLFRQVERQVDRTPDAAAVVFPSTEDPGLDVTLSYGALDRAANRLAHRLIELGARAGSLVGLCLERSAEMIVAQLAIQKTGAAYVPLDPGFPADRLAYMADDAGLDLAVTTAALSGLLPSSLTLCRIDADAAAIAAASDQRPAVQLDDTARMYVIYTSGSTGKPKGVELEHRSVSNFMASMAREPGFGPGDSILAVTTLSFDISVLETVLPLVAGGTVVVAPKEATGDGERLAALLARLCPTHVQATPATWRMLLLAGWRGDPDLTILCGGEALPRELADELLPRGRAVWNLYGPTEATIWSTLWRVEPGPRVSIGRPLANTRVYVLDDELRPLPIGVPGELWIAGDGLARGYLGREDLTAERFVPDPLSAGTGGAPGSRMYRTGDLARWRADGTLECLGRVDDQVKLRGYRIELGEIEAVLEEHAGVRQCAVVVREDRPGDQRLVAYLVPERDAPAAEELRALAAAALPAYMVPAAFVALEALPLTPNRKVDRRALLALEAAAPETAVEHVEPRGDLERAVAEVFAEVLGLERVGRHDDFFALGGNSLLTTQAVARLRARLGIDLPLRDLFEDSTVAGLAARAALAAPERRTRIEPVPRDGRPLPLSFTQQRLWFLDQLEPDRAVYNVWVGWTLRGALDEQAFERAVAEIWRRHEVLRTHFEEVDGIPSQHIEPAGEPAIERLERPAGLDDDAWRDELRRRMTDRVQVPFRLSVGPLMRFALARVADEEHVFCVTAHHTIFDGWSMGRFRLELGALYAAFAAGQPSPLPELELQYADFAAWQRAWLAAEAHEEQLAWWREQLAGAAVLELPTDRPRPAEQSYQGASVTRELPAPLMDALDRLGATAQTTPFMTLLAALTVLLYRHGGQTDLSVGTVVAGRGQRELEELMGYFANTLVMRTDLSGDPSFRELLGRVREVALGAYDHQDTPFEQLVAELQPARDLSHTPLFQALFVLDDSREPERDLGDLELDGFEVENHVARTDLTLWARRHSGGLIATFEYATDLFDHDTVERMLAHLERLLESAVASPEAPISALDLLPADERRELLETRNPAPRPFPETAVHHQFEARVDLAPEATALTLPTVAGAGDERVSYAELDARANRLAHHLIERGVRPDELVGLCLERSTDMVAAQLAILKAGAAYVPLDPLFPPERLTYMVEDSGLRHVVSVAELAELLPDAAVERIDLDVEAESIAARSDARPAVQVDVRARMYVIYTSGSTGRPKGVELEHRSVSNFLASMARRPGLSAGDVWLAVTTLSFDISVLEIFLPLVVGGTVAIATSEVAADGELLRAILERLAPNVMQATPATWRMLLLAGWEGDPGVAGDDGTEGGLCIFCGGEALPRELADELLPRGRELWNLYGPTETTVWSTVWKVRPAPEPILIGRALDNTRAYVLDDRGQPAPDGVPGHLWIGGDGLARGYLGRPELTAERFVPDPFVSDPGAPDAFASDAGDRPRARMYHTGDLARWRPGGSLECLGRVDNQVKVRGFRIELGEIETVLSEHPDVSQAVALVREDTPGDQRLVAYVVLEPGSGGQPPELDPPALREQCRGRLPGYMIPSAFAALEALPLTPNGKLDRRALLALGQVATAGGGGDFVAPESETEQALAAIWGELLGLERVGTLDNFFDLGGHSLLSVQVTARVRDRLGVRITPRDLMLQSLGQLASVLEERAARDAALEDERHRPGRRLVDALSGIFRRRRD